MVIILGILCDFFESNEGILEKNMLRDISFTVLRNIIIETPSPSPIAVTIVHFLFPKLLSQLMTDTVLENQMDIINVMIELLSRFGVEIASLSFAEQKHIQTMLVHLLDSPYTLIRKRSVIALGKNIFFYVFNY